MDTSFLTGKIIGYRNKTVKEPLLNRHKAYAQRLLRIEEETPLKDQKIALWNNGYRTHHHFSLARLRERVGVRAMPPRKNSLSWPRGKPGLQGLPSRKKKNSPITR